MGRIRVASMHQALPPGFTEVDTTSRSGRWSGLSPFTLGPVPLYEGALPQTGNTARNLENAWQFAKLYHGQADDQGNPTDAYWAWARRGWDDSWAHRYPMGKGAIPLCSVWKGQKLDYIAARKAIYGPLYAHCVQKTQAYAELQALAAHTDVVLLDFDGYDHDRLGVSLVDVLHNPKKKMGHAFVLKMLLTQDVTLGALAPV